MKFRPERMGFFLKLLLTFVTVGATLGVANAQPPRSVQDDAGFFSTSAKAKANADIAEIKRRFKKDLLIETFLTTQRPKSLDKDDKKAVAKFFNEWAVQRFKNQAVNGVYVVILQKPPILRVVVGNKTRDRGLFTTQNREELVTIFKTNLKSGEKDQALLEGAAYVRNIIARNASSKSSMTAQKKAVAKKTEKSQSGFLGISLLGWVLLGLGAIIVIWILFALMRAASGAGSYAAGDGGGAGGGGSGWVGFFPGLLGGLFGAAAGMWLYNSFFGGQSAQAAPTQSEPANVQSETDVGEEASVGGDNYDEDKRDWGNDDDGGWGDDDGGGDDWNGGSGDW